MVTVEGSFSALSRRLAGCIVAAALLVGCGNATARRPVTEGRDLPAGVVQMRWRTVVHEHGLFEPQPEECARGVVVGDRLVIGSRAGRIVGVDTANGNIAWSTPISGSVDSEARFDELQGQVYVGADDGAFYAVDPTTGAIRWSYKAKGAIERPPEIGGNAVYVSTASNHLYALEAHSGRWRWQYERDTPDGFTIHGHAGSHLRDGVLYTGFSDGFLVALQAANGEILWAKSLASASDQFVDVDSTPAFHKDLVIASSYSGGLYGLAARNGDSRWRLNIQGAGTVAVIADRLYMAAPRDGVAALSPDGQILWRQGLADAGDLTTPFAAGPFLIFSGNRSGLFIIDRASGRLLQTFNPGRGMCAAAAPSPDGNSLYVLANSGSLYALDLLP